MKKYSNIESKLTLAKTKQQDGKKKHCVKILKSALTLMGQ